MYKKLLSALLLSGISGASFAQTAPTLTAATFNPQLNDAFATHVCLSAGVTPGLGGANVIWNFSSGLVSTQTDTGKAVSVASTTAGAIVTLYAPATNIAVVTPTTSTTLYSIESSSKLSATGYYQSASQYAYYTDPMDEVQYPLNYNNTYSDTYAGVVQISGVPGPLHGSGIIYDTCDGWGSLILPGPMTYSNVLRVHSVQTYVDSADLFGTPSLDTFLIETYTWYTPNYHNALMTINTTTGLGLASALSYKLVSYDSFQISNAKVPVVNNIDASLNIFPNPAKNVININFDAASGGLVKINMLDMLGREVALITNVYGSGLQNITYNTSSIPKGSYIVCLQSGDEITTRKIVIE